MIAPVGTRVSGEPLPNGFLDSPDGSLNPFALLLPTVIRRYAMPREAHSRSRLPWNSAPLSVQMYRGFPQVVIILW